MSRRRSDYPHPNYWGGKAEHIRVELDTSSRRGFALVVQQRFHAGSGKPLTDPRRMTLTLEEARKVHGQLGEFLEAHSDD